MSQQDFAIEPLEPLIFTIRGQRVMLDADLARVYGVPTKVFNQAVKRNAARFPEDFAFQLTAEETANLRSQFVTSNLPAAQPADNPDSSQNVMSPPQGPSSQGGWNWSQFVTSSSRHRGATYRPWAFTEHGALMAANVLRSERAVQMSVFVIRAFVRLREQVASNQAILKRLAEIDKTLLQHDASLRDIYRKLLPLLQPPPNEPKRRLGFHTDDK
ncbi:MAG: ORF6N domain-containing protein [Chloroflexi bacterium]|nr:ORF6N domain-containing protein [Chloroflexota bacterium]